MRTDEDEWLTTGECAKLLGRPMKTVIDWRHRKVGPPYFKHGKVRYLKSDVLAFRASMRVEPAKVAA